MNPKLFTYKLKLSGYKKNKQAYFMILLKNKKTTKIIYIYYT